MQQQKRLLIGVLALALASSGCFGSFNLTRKLYNWNETISHDKWAKEVVFLVLVWAPIYGLAGLGDAVVFNSIEFWTGRNPIDMQTSSLPQMKRIVRGEAEAVLRLDAQHLSIDQFQSGRPAGGLRVTRQGELTVATNEQGRTLFTAQTLADGNMLVYDATGKQIASYTPQEIDRMVASTRN